MKNEKRLKSIIELHENQIDFETLNEFIKHINDNNNDDVRTIFSEFGNSMTIEKWCLHYEKIEILQLTKEQIILIFNYLNNFHKNLINKSGSIYFVLVKRNYKLTDLNFEEDIFKTLTLSNKTFR